MRRTHVIVLGRKVRRAASGRRANARRSVARGKRFAVVVRRPVDDVCRAAVVRRVVVRLFPLQMPRFPVIARPRDDTVRCIRVLSEHSALERLTGLDRLLRVSCCGGVLHVFGTGRRAVPIAVDRRLQGLWRRRRRRLDRRRFRWVVVAPVLVRRLVDVLRRTVTANRVNAVGHALPRHRAADRPADFLTRPRRRRFAVVRQPFYATAVAARRPKHTHTQTINYT